MVGTEMTKSLKVGRVRVDMVLGKERESAVTVGQRSVEPESPSCQARIKTSFRCIVLHRLWHQHPWWANTNSN